MPDFADVAVWTAADGARLALRRARAAGRVRGALILLHGFGDHAARYGELAAWFAETDDAPFVLLDISSDSAVADVVVDGLTLGPSPVTAFVPPGLRRIEVRGRGGPAIQEVVELRPGDRFLRDYEIGRAHV